MTTSDNLPKTCGITPSTIVGIKALRISDQCMTADPLIFRHGTWLSCGRTETAFVHGIEYVASIYKCWQADIGILQSPPHSTRRHTRRARSKRCDGRIFPYSRRLTEQLCHSRRQRRLRESCQNCHRQCDLRPECKSTSIRSNHSCTRWLSRLFSTKNFLSKPHLDTFIV